jgi:hypothetical protein
MTFISDDTTKENQPFTLGSRSEFDFVRLLIYFLVKLSKEIIIIILCVHKIHRTILLVLLRGRRALE